MMLCENQMARDAGAMLNLSETTLAAMEAQAAADEASRLARWWQHHAAVLGIRGKDDCQLLLLNFAEEFAQTGLRDERQKFAFIAARQLMPDMGDMQFLAVMDVLVTDIDDAARLRAITQIAQTIGAD